MKNTASPERYVSVQAAADFLEVKPRYLLELARAGAIPGYPLGEGKRRIWRFKLSEVDEAMAQRRNQPKP